QPLTDRLAVTVANTFTQGRQRLGRFQVAEADVALQGQVALPRVEHLEQHHLVPQELKVIEAVHEPSDLVEAVGNHHYQAALATQGRGLVNRPAGLRLLPPD